MTERRTKQRKKRSSSTVDYFNEEEFLSEILPLVHQDKKLPDSFAYSIFAITDGMINTEFRQNTYVLANRDELKQQCFFEILKSLKKFKGEKGRSFAYFNRIIKNTLLKVYYKNMRISSKELKVYDISPEYETSEEMTLDEAFSYFSGVNLETTGNNICNNSFSFSNFFDNDYSKFNIIDKKIQEESLIDVAIFKYIRTCLKKINHIYKDEFISFCNNIKYSFDSEYSEDLEDSKIFEILKATRELFFECLENIIFKVKNNLKKYENLDYDKCVLVNHKVLVYVRREISNKDIRKKYPILINNAKLSAEIIKFLLENS